MTVGVEDAAGQGDRMSHVGDAGDRAVAEGVPLHDRGVHLHRAVGGEDGAPARVEARIVLHGAHRGLDGIDGAAPILQADPPRGHGIADALTQVVAAGGGIGARSPVDEERRHAACHGEVLAASIMA
jgi:hypothetical protein